MVVLLPSFLRAKFMRFLVVNIVLGGFYPPPLYFPEHITYILQHDPSDSGDSVDVMLGVVFEVNAGHEVQVFEGSV